MDEDERYKRMSDMLHAERVQALIKFRRAQYIKTLTVLHKAGQRGGKDVRKVINIIHRQNMDRVL